MGSRLGSARLDRDAVAPSLKRAAASSLLAPCAGHIGEPLDRQRRIGRPAVT